jgi:hypothetical protein
MSQAKIILRKHPRKGLPLLGAAGLSLSLGGGASATIGVTTADIATCSTALNHEQTLREEEIADISLSTFHIFDRESTPRLRGRIVAGACVAGACVAYGPATNGGGSGPPPPSRKPTQPYVHTLKRPQVPKDQDQNAKRATQHEAGTRSTNRNVTRQAQPEVDGLVIDQSAGPQVQPQVASPVINSAN